MKKAFNINGGAGRVLCSIPALEYFVDNISNDIIIICDGWADLFLLSTKLLDKVYLSNDRYLKLIINEYEIITPEPYHLSAYINQKVNLIQAFDIIINNLTEIPVTKKFSPKLFKNDRAYGQSIINQAKQIFQREKIIVIQPFGSGFKKYPEGYILDETGRSFEIDDFEKIIEILNKEFGIIVMSDIKPDTSGPLNVMAPEGLSLIQWASIINAADYFIGCDSIGQHLAYIFNKKSTVVFGATFPENVSYINDNNFTIVDNGKHNRKYSYIRILNNFIIDKYNEDLMQLTDESINAIISSVVNERTYNAS